MNHKIYLNAQYKHSEQKCNKNIFNSKIIYQKERNLVEENSKQVNFIKMGFSNSKTKDTFYYNGEFYKLNKSGQKFGIRGFRLKYLKNEFMIVMNDINAQ